MDLITCPHKLFVVPDHDDGVVDVLHLLLVSDVGVSFVQIRDWQIGIRNSGFWFRDSGFRIRISGFLLPGFGFQARGFGFGVEI